MTDKLNIVLVHGAFADGSHWRHIIPRLYGAGHRVMAAQNPLTSLADDIATTRPTPGTRTHHQHRGRRLIRHPPGT